MEYQLVKNLLNIRDTLFMIVIDPFKIIFQDLIISK